MLSRHILVDAMYLQRMAPNIDLTQQPRFTDTIFTVGVLKIMHEIDSLPYKGLWVFEFTGVGQNHIEQKGRYPNQSIEKSEIHLPGRPSYVQNR